MAFSTSLSGVNAAQSDLDVISNNIANSSTRSLKLPGPNLVMCMRKACWVRPHRPPVRV